MISPIGFNIRNIKQAGYFNNNSVSFGKKPSAVDLYRSGDKTFNSQNLLQSLKDGDYRDALSFLQLCCDDFDPNYKDENDLSLIGALYNFPSKTKDGISQFYRHKEEILLRIFDHPDFDPNQSYSLKVGGKDGFYLEPERYYIDDAVENNDVYLATLLYKTGVGVFDKYFDDFETLRKKTRNKNLKYIVSQFPLFLKGAKAEKPNENSPAKTVSVVYENDKVKPFRANLSESVPESLDDVGGLKDAKKSIEQFIIKPWNPDIRPQLKDNGVQLPNGFLMYGPPGCGKTYLAKVIAKQTGFPMYEVDLSNIGTSAAYQTAKTIRSIFAALEEQYAKNNMPSILFLDEIDSIAASRSGSHTDWKRDDVNALITQLNNASEKGVIVIGATNFLDNVDEAVLRPGRFDKKIEIKLPDKEERKDIIQKITAKKKIAVDLYDMADELAEKTDGKSPSELSAALNIACLNAICAGKKTVTKQDFLSSLKELEYEKNKQHRIIGFGQ